VRSRLSVGRTIYDAPDIDNIVLVKRKLSEGEIYRGKVLEVSEYEWLVEVIK
jgi:hypothetical protein